MSCANYCGRKGDPDFNGLCGSCFAQLLELESSNPLAVSEVKSDTAETKHKINNLLNSGCSISVNMGDLTCVKSDCVVNAANSLLQHSSGLSGAIAKKGGAIIQQESSQYIKLYGRVPPGNVVVTQAGSMPCKYIIHAVGPFYRDGKTQEARVLYDATYKSLEAANALGESVSLPALSSGIFGYPLDQVALVLMQAALDFVKQTPNLRLKEIAFTNFDNRTVNAFVNVAKKLDKITNTDKLIDIDPVFDLYQALYSNEYKTLPSAPPQPPLGSVFPRDYTLSPVQTQPPQSTASSSAGSVATLTRSELVKIEADLQQAIASAQTALTAIQAALQNAK